MSVVENLKFVIGAGETKTFEKGGRYFNFLSGQAPLTVKLLSKNGVVLADMRDIDSGTYFKTEVDFEAFQVLSQWGQTVKIFIADGQAGQNIFSGVVSGSVNIGSMDSGLQNGGVHGGGMKTYELGQSGNSREQNATLNNEAVIFSRQDDSPINDWYSAHFGYSQAFAGLKLEISKIAIMVDADDAFAIAVGSRTVMPNVINNQTFPVADDSGYRFPARYKKNLEPCLDLVSGYAGGIVLSEYADSSTINGRKSQYYRVPGLLGKEVIFETPLMLDSVNVLGIYCLNKNTAAKRVRTVLHGRRVA